MQAYAKKSALKGGLDKTMALRKEMQEMQEWINQAEEDYLERDFTYKTPEELRKAVEELKVCVQRLVEDLRACARARSRRRSKLLEEQKLFSSFWLKKGSLFYF